MNEVNENSEVQNPEIQKTPESCDKVEDFDKALANRSNEISQKMDVSPEFNDQADKLAENSNVRDVLRQKNKLGDGKEYADAYKEACFGNHEGMSEEEKAANIAIAKENWEGYQQQSHLCDMALERHGYTGKPSETTTDETVFAETSGSEPPPDVPQNTTDHKHLSEGFKYFDDIASSKGTLITLPDRNYNGNPPETEPDYNVTNNLKEQPSSLPPEKREEIIDSGNSHREYTVDTGEIFIRIGGQFENSSSPYFTKFEQISDISFIDKDGVLHLDEDTFRDRLGLPESSKIDFCRIYETHKSGTITCSTVAETAEHWGAVKHPGGGTQYLFTNRNEFFGSEPAQTLKVQTYSREEFNELKKTGNFTPNLKTEK